MQLLKDRILREGHNLGNGILKVDSFINHQVDAVLMDECGKELAQRFKDIGATKSVDRRNFRNCTGIDHCTPLGFAGGLCP